MQDSQNLLKNTKMLKKIVHTLLLCFETQHRDLFLVLGEPFFTMYYFSLMSNKNLGFSFWNQKFFNTIIVQCAACIYLHTTRTLLHMITFQNHKTENLFMYWYKTVIKSLVMKHADVIYGWALTYYKTYWVRYVESYLILGIKGLNFTQFWWWNLTYYTMYLTFVLDTKTFYYYFTTTNSQLST